MHLHLLRALRRSLATAALLVGAAFGFVATAAAADARLPKLTLSGPYAAVSYPLIHMVESGALADLAQTVEFVALKERLVEEIRVEAVLAAEAH